MSVNIENEHLYTHACIHQFSDHQLTIGMHEYFRYNNKWFTIMYCQLDEKIITYTAITAMKAVRSWLYVCTEWHYFTLGPVLFTYLFMWVLHNIILRNTQS